MNENARACWGHRHITWHSDFNFARIGYEKTIGKMGAAFAQCESQATILKQCLEMFQHNPDEFLCRFITVDETWIYYFIPETEEIKTTGWTSSEKGEDRKIGRKGDGHSFLGRTRYNSYRLPSVEASNQWRLLSSLIGPFQHFKEKTSPFGEEESALPSK